MDEFDPTNYKPNSHAYKERLNGNQEQPREKKVEKVVTGVVKTKKKSELNKFANAFISEEAKDLKGYIFMDVLVPAIKNTIYDMVTNSLSMIFFKGPNRSKKSSGVSNISYRSYYDDQRDRYRTDPPRTRTGYNYDDIVLETRMEAEEVIARMDELVDTYGVVSVADLYDLIGKTAEYTDNKYGWTNIRNAEAIRVRDGYMLKLPKVAPINN